MPVEITLTVTRFTENPSSTHPAKDKTDENCAIEAQLKMNGETTNVTGETIQVWQHDADKQVFICPLPDVGVIAVKKTKAGPVLFSFVIKSAGAVPALRPTDIKFEQQPFKKEPNRSLEDADGALNFDFMGTEGNKLTIADRWESHGPSKNRDDHRAPHWKFWIRVETTDGTARKGWIDPTIENSDDMTV